jgi:hypothetical protein
MYDSLILIRLEGKIAKVLKVVARARGEHVSSFARRAIMVELARLGFLAPEESKALGINHSSSGTTKPGVGIELENGSDTIE